MLSDQCDRTNRVVVTRNGEVDLRWIAVRVDDCNDRDTEALGLGHGNVLFFNIYDEQYLGQLFHFLDATEELLQTYSLGCKHE